MIYKYQYKGNNIVVDVNSGAVHVFDELAWKIVDYFTQGCSEKQAANELKETSYDGAAFNDEEIHETWLELLGLKARGLLAAKDLFLEQQQPRQSVIKSICLHVAHDCNLKCKYCFAGTGSFGGSRELMSLETGKKALDFLLLASGNRHNLEVDFFGGEPLLNFEIVRKLVEYGDQQAAQTGKKIKFTLTTNAVLLNDTVRDYLNQHQISVVLSLDGRKEIHDAMRPFGNGEGSYDYIIGNIDNFIASRNNQGYYLRGTYTRFNPDFAEDVKFMAERGYKELSVEPVVAPEDLDYAFREEDLPQLLAEYDRLTEYYLQKAEQNRPFNFFHFNVDLFKGPCLYKRMVGCGAGHEYLAVSPEGKLYPCHQFVGQEEFCLGSVFEDTIAHRLSGNKCENKIMKHFMEANVYNKEKCSKCWAKFFCSGGCHANAWYFNNDLMVPYEIGCILEKKRLECAIYIQLKQAGLAS